MEKYCYLASVYDGERIRVVRIERCQNIYSGDLIRLNDGKLGEVVCVIFTEIGGEDYAFVADLKPIEEDWIEFYRHGGRKGGL